MSHSPDEPGLSRGRSVWSFNCGATNGEDLQGAFLDDMALAERLGRPLPPRVADLVELAAAVHVVDRSSKRPPASRAGDSWSRQLHVRIGVRETTQWGDQGRIEELEGFLRRLTDDTWRFEFVERVAPARPTECISFLLETPTHADVVALYSGGLDSIAGLLIDLDGDVQPLLVSAVTNTRLAKSQTETLRLLKQGCSFEVQRVPVELHLKHASARESTQRARGFGFLALAAAAAALAQLVEVHVYENGIGAINLPYTAAQAGTRATKAMHPETLRRASSLFSRLLDCEIRITDPCILLTKAEMCQRLPAGSHDAVLCSGSCDTAFSHRATAIDSCGTCTSCILRRQALHAAGLGELDEAEKYRMNAFSATAASGDSYILSAMLSQVAHLSTALGQVDPWLGLVREFPDLAVLSDSRPGRAASSELLSLFRRYVAEWSSVPTPLLHRFVPITQSSAA